MTKKFEIYKCETCGNIIEIIEGGEGELICCGKPMELLKEKTEEEYSEKHKPIVIIEDKNVTVKVGEVPHPMSKEHYIMFIEAISLDGQYIKRKYLKPEELPELSFICKSMEMETRALCNIHGLWKNR